MKIVYVSVGSILSLNKEQFKRVYQGLNETEGIFVIWSHLKIQEDLTPEIKNNSKFFIRNYIPQYEVL